MLYANLPVADYDLDVTLSCGQAFRWVRRDDGWEGVVGSRWVRLCRAGDCLVAQTAEAVPDWRWLAHYLQMEANLAEIVATFPQDEPMRAAVAACRGMRLLRQDPWECLASFICSSTKQIVQIQQIIALLCQRFGESVVVPQGRPETWTFPTAQRLANASETELRACKLGFRAPNLRAAAQKVASGEVKLDGSLSLDDARAELTKLPGVGPKIADCALLFGFGYQRAFPVDTWIMHAMRRLYFPKRKIKPPQIRHFIDTYFGPHAGYAQQYLFHYMRTKVGRSNSHYVG